jgi:hypothetical protein
MRGGAATKGKKTFNRKERKKEGFTTETLSLQIF